MVLRIACIASLAITSLARAQPDNPAMALMGVMMRCPAMSADGKHIAIYSYDPAGDKNAKTSLVVFGAGGAVEQRIAVVPPATDATRAKATADKLVKLLDDGKYKRMARMSRESENRAKAKYDTQLKSEDLVVDVHVADRKVTLDATRAGKKLAPITVALGAKDGACKSVAGYSLLNTAAGYDPKTGLFAFSIVVEDSASVCFGHDFVVALK